MKPIFYYIENHTTSVICDHYGPYLEKLNTAQKLELIGYLGLWLAEVVSADDDDEDIGWGDRPVDGSPDQEVMHVLNFCDKLEPSQVVDFMAGVVEVTTV